MSNDTTAEIRGKLSQSLQQLQADADNVATSVNNITGLFHHARAERYHLIRKARGILESSGVVDPLGCAAHLVMSEYNRLREILDELERLP